MSATNSSLSSTTVTLTNSEVSAISDASHAVLPDMVLSMESHLRRQSVCSSRATMPRRRYVVCNGNYRTRAVHWTG